MTKLLSYLKPKEVEGSLATADTVIKGNVLELIIALVKDLRGDLYKDFVKKIMPQVIAIIDVQNIQLIDKVFTLFSFSFKYLLKPIREDIKNFYHIY